jgi:DNA topoisomerase-1
MVKKIAKKKTAKKKSTDPKNVIKKGSRRKAAAKKVGTAKSTKKIAATKLLIVESPTKVRTIKKFLGPEFEIIASKGHVRDLLKTGERKMGIDVHGDFQGQYGEIPTKKKAISELRNAARHAKEIYLAPDPDREGEAIAWHIQELLREGGHSEEMYRVSFNEITPRAVQESLAHPRRIDQKKVDAQETRRKLDRIVGFKLSGEILWNKVAFGLSAGRVQSVALRLISEREAEIQAFVPKEFWTISALMEKSGAQPEFEAKLHRINGEEPEIPDEARALELTKIIENANLKITKVERKERRRRPPAPFITSTLQQECSTKLRFGAKRTMSLAQSLYEGVNLGKEQGNVGLITYMRTDSRRLAPEAIEMARKHITKHFGAPYLPDTPPVYKAAQNAQDAHEAVRPTDASLTPALIKYSLKPEQLAVYTLIWQRFMASQMTQAVFDQTSVDIMAEDLLLRASGSILKFPGFLKVYQDDIVDSEGGAGEGSGNSSGKDRLLPALENNDQVALVASETTSTGVLPEQHFTQPRPRYTEAALVKELEEDGVGRPSTYASILDTLEKRRYVTLERKNRQFTPSSLGLEVNKLLVQGFPEEINVKFTAKVENDLDDIESGTQAWLPILQAFYEQFDKKVQEAKTTLPNLKTQTEPIDRECPECQSPLVKKFSRNGWFISCSGYPDCKHSESMIPEGEDAETDEEIAQIEEKAPPCEDCGEPMRAKRGPYGLYLCCSVAPKEHKTRRLDASGQAVQPPESTGIACASKDCRGELVSRNSRRTGKKFYGCNQFPKCKYVIWDFPILQECPTCSHPHLTVKTTKKNGIQLVCPANSCDYAIDATPALAAQAANANGAAPAKAEKELV